MRRRSTSHLLPIDGIRALLGQAVLFARAPHALRWRAETFGLYMPSLPESRPWWRANGHALRAFARQLPGYTRWLGTMRALRRDGARGYWMAESGTDSGDWERWLSSSS